jgi:hypothetical protein
MVSYFYALNFQYITIITKRPTIRNFEEAPNAKWRLIILKQYKPLQGKLVRHVSHTLNAITYFGNLIIYNSKRRVVNVINLQQKTLRRRIIICTHLLLLLLSSQKYYKIQKYRELDNLKLLLSYQK